MTDIVERLREGVFGSDETKTDTVIHAHMQVAADEIERLRAERNQWIANSRENKLIAESNLRERDAARREGIEAAWGVVADEPVPEGKLTFHEVMQRDERMMERIRALLEDGR